jgi:hypothetical protein
MAVPELLYESETCTVTGWRGSGEKIQVSKVHCTKDIKRSYEFHGKLAVQLSASQE